MNLNLKEKQALVCGSTQGIGRAIAEELASLGASVVLVARNEDKLKTTLQTLHSGDGQDHQYIVADFTNPHDLKSKVEGFLNEGNQPQILINNTGGPSGGAILEEPYEKFSNTLSAHLECNHLLVQALVPVMRAQEYGRIVNVISTSVKQPIPGLGVSNTVRGAVASWAKTLSYELAKFGITINNVLPGLTNTGRLDYIVGTMAESSGKSKNEIISAMESEIPARRIGEPSEVAALAAFLTSPAAAYINGTSIPVDGGKTSAI